MAENIGGDVGDDACVYRNTGTYAVPVWAMIEGIRDDNISDVWGEADVSARMSEFTLMRKNRRTVGVTLTMIHDKDDVDYMALRTAAFGKTATMDLLFLPCPISVVGTKGIRAVCQVFTHDHARPLQGGQEVTFTVKPTRFYDTGVLKPPVEFIVSA